MGVRVLFENSTVCRTIKASRALYEPHVGSFEMNGWTRFVLVCRDIEHTNSLLESLILAQDERWRRA